jgi:rod shape-determining protein MreB
VRDAALHAGARRVYLIREPLAAAIGARVPVADPSGNMVIDIGGGTTEIAVISLNGIVVAKSLRVGGNKVRRGDRHYIKRTTTWRSATGPPKRSRSRSARRCRSKRIS